MEVDCKYQLALELEQVPDEDPGGKEGGPDAPGKAFEEHELIRNTYIDAFIQKVVYGPTHQGLAHMLKSSCRTIATHLDIGAKGVADMAQTIRTVENWLGVNINSIISTFTFCSICWRLYLPGYMATTKISPAQLRRTS
ncbi:hypothetical protein BDV93DRAFT_514080 [Ceratobasidium sp. AG-I]|nr:hypothetical protein BDV93DRAFT_514080 [Ceratobasidium sp. AG-I]